MAKRRRDILKARLKFNPYPSSMRSTRMGIILLAFLLTSFSFLLIFNLYKIQIVSGDEYRKKAADIHFRKRPYYPERGSIMDSNGFPLAVTSFDYSVGMTPSAVKSWSDSDDAPGKAKISDKLAEILEIPTQQMSEYMAQNEATYIHLLNGLSVEKADELKAYINKYSIGGIVMDAVMRREYPQKDKAAAIVGFVAKPEDIISGINGLESYYNDKLSGKPGFSYAPVDNYYYSRLPFSEEIIQEAVDPLNIKTHLNLTIQGQAQKIAEQYRYAFEANNCEVIVMNPKTGAVYAMASDKNFDLNDPYGAPSDSAEEGWNPFKNEEQMRHLTEDIWKERNTQIIYEPGSVFKVLTVAIGMEEKVFSEEELFSDDPIWVEGYDSDAISCYSGTGHGMENVRMALVRSCNPVMVQIQQRIGLDKYYEYIHSLGLYERTGVDLPAESYPVLHTDPKPIDAATLSFGESSSVSPLQTISTVSSIGNGGYLMQPQIAESFVDKDGKTVKKIEPVVKRRVFSKETTDRMLDYMTDVVDITYPEAKPYGYPAGGKSSTSNWGFFGEYVVTSFVMLAPIDDPQLAVLVITHESQTMPRNPCTGVGLLTMLALEQLEIPKYSSHEDELFRLASSKVVNNYLGRNISEICFSERENHLLFDIEAHGDGDKKVAYQYPPQGSKINGRGNIYLSHSGKPLEETVVVPNFVGMTYDDAYRMAEKNGLNLYVSGDVTGKVTSQSTDAEKKLLKYSIVELNFE